MRGRWKMARKERNGEITREEKNKKEKERLERLEHRTMLTECCRE